MLDKEMIEYKMSGPSFDPMYQMYTQGVASSNKARYASYLKSMKKYDISVLNDKMNYDKTMADIDKYTKLARSDYIAGLAKLDVNLADALQTATESYGANLLGSGLQLAKSTEMINESEMAKQGLKEERKNTLDKYNDLRNYTIAKHERITKPLNEMNRPEYRPSSPESREAYALDLINKDI